jgi:hypothetical protein
MAIFIALMADLPYMYAIVTGVFIVLAGILFGSRAKRVSGEPKVQKEGKKERGKEGAPI